MTAIPPITIPYIPILFFNNKKHRHKLPKTVIYACVIFYENIASISLISAETVAIETAHT